MSAPGVMKYAPAQARRGEQQQQEQITLQYTTRNTLIENAPQVSVRRAPPPSRLHARREELSPMSDHFPTPRAIPSRMELGGGAADSPAVKMTTTMTAAVAHGSPDSNSSTGSHSADGTSLWSKRSSESDFDEMYDLSESDSEPFPIKLSMSVKKRVRGDDGETKSRYPSLVIPSPSHWPTIDKLRSATALSPPLQIALSPAILSQLKDRDGRMPGPASAPSLDGSLTSEELAASSCPPTPDIAEAAEENQEWEAPMQLDPSSITLLAQLTVDEQPEEPQPMAEIPQEAMVEMRKIAESSTVAGYFKLHTQNLTPANPIDMEDELSALSIPSPGGFFASLDSTVARATWTEHERAPNTGIATEFYGLPFRRRASSLELQTSTAKSFYDLPWAERPGNPVEHIVTLKSPAEEEPITARKGLFSPSETIAEVDEIDETYGDALQDKAGEHINRTQLWLHAQGAYMKALCEEPDNLEDFADIEGAIPKTPEHGTFPANESVKDDSPGKKSVRFAATEPESPVVSDSLKRLEDAEKKRISPIHDGTFWQAWRHTKRSARARDVFVHRQARAEADQVKRVSLQKKHCDQLQGKFAIVDADADRPDTHRPISSMIPTAPEDDSKALIAQAGRERQALEQIQSSSWHISAKKEVVNGGQLLTSPVVQSFKIHRDVMILDLAGQTQCSWAWSVAAEHPDATVYSAVASDIEAHIAESSYEGPTNHFVVTAPKLWELPFESNVFDVVSARNLYTHLKTIWPQGMAADEWDLTLRECLRVLKPGGYLEFEMLDAELVHSESATQALGVEFSFNLKTRGYDPCAGKSFLPRVKRAGFCEIKRAWMVLPVADVVPKWSDNGKKVPGTQVGGSDNGLAISLGKGMSQTKAGFDFEPPVTGSTRDVRAMTGLVGARMWEQWILKLNNEMGRDEVKCMEQVAKALEDGGKGGAGWRCLVGWARKDV